MSHPLFRLVSHSRIERFALPFLLFEFQVKLKHSLETYLFEKVIRQRMDWGWSLAVVTKAVTYADWN